MENITPKPAFHLWGKKIAPTMCHMPEKPFYKYQFEILYLLLYFKRRPQSNYLKLRQNTRLSTTK